MLITGGTSGIGLAMAEAFLRQGATVAVCGRSADALEVFSCAHPDALAIRADVTVGADRAAMIETVAGQFGRLDILINNAGTFIERDFAADGDITQDLEREIALNLTAPIQLTGEALNRWPDLGSIVFVTSGFALVSPARAPTYGAAKAGLRAFADGLRRQLAARGTHVLEVLPTTTDTRMNANLKRKKMPAMDVATLTLKALAQRRPVALAGELKFVPMLLRLAPETIKRLVAKA